MQAADIMTANVISITPDTEVRDIAKILLDHHIGAVPVLDAGARLVGIVSEGELVQRIETGTEPAKSWWLDLLGSTPDRDIELVKSRGCRAGDVMTLDPVSVTPETPIAEVARVLEARRIKRVPVVSEGKLVGIISRANLLHGLASARPSGEAPTIDDRAVRDAILKTIRDELGMGAINVIVRGGAVELWGTVDDEAKARAIVVAAETTEGVKSAESHVGRVPNWACGV